MSKSIKGKGDAYYPTINPKASRNCFEEKIIFKNNGIKWRTSDEISEEEKQSLFKKNYIEYTIDGIKVIAFNLKRALQTINRIQHI